MRLRFSSLWQRGLLCVVVLAGEFLALEGGLRAVGGSDVSAEFRSLFLQDARMGYRLKPGAHARYATEEFRTEIAINGQGVRDDDDIGPKAADERRVLVLGDSLVLSVQVSLTQTFCKGLERRLASADPTHRWRVINGGVQGYGPVEEWLFYRDVAEALQPDIVLMVPFVGNDAIEAYDKETWLTLGHPPAGRSVDATANLVRRTIRRSAVLQVARVRVDQLRSHFATPGIERPLMTYLVNPPVDVTHGLEVTRQAFGLIAARAEAGGARAALALMPARFQVDDAGYEQMAAAARLGGHELARNVGTERFEAALAPLELPTLDLLPVLASQPDRSGLFFQRNVHLTPRGHDVVAEALFRFLVDHRLTFRPSL